MQHKTIDFTRDIKEILERKHLNPKLFEDSDEIDFEDSIHKHTQWVYENIYSVNYPNGHPRSIHGIQHVTRVAMYIPIWQKLFAEFGDKRAQEFTPDDIHTLQIVALFHDAGREADGEDLWEEDSAILLYHYLVTVLQFDTENAELFATAIVRGEPNKPFTIEATLLHDADCLDIIRARKNFDSTYLGFYKEIASKNADAKLKMDELIAEAKKWIASQGDDFSRRDMSLKEKYSDKDAHDKMLAELVDHKDDYKILASYGVNNALLMDLYYKKLQGAVALLTKDDSQHSEERTKANKKLREKLEDLENNFTKPEECVEKFSDQVKAFSVMLEKKKSLYNKDPDYYILSCIGHLLASIVTLGIYAGICAYQSHQSRQTAKFWRPSDHIYLERVEEQLESAPKFSG